MAMTEVTGGGTHEAQWLKWRSVADLYHAYFTGLILTVVTRRGTADAAEFVFRVFRRQQQERFLPGLEKLGLSHSATHRRAGSGAAPRSAACPAKCRARCCEAGTPTMAFRSAIQD